MVKKRYLAAAALSVLAILFVVFSWPPSYTYHERPLPATFAEFYQQQLDTSRAHHAVAGNEEKWLKVGDGHSHIAILYIHGFGASRAEGEFVVDSLSKLYNANVYYMRLPGHGTNYEDQATVKYSDYLDQAIATLKMMHHLGDKVIVVGTSMGGLISTYLAAEYPQLVDGLILCSPFYDYNSNFAKIIKVPGALTLTEWMDGPLRRMGHDTVWMKKTEPGYADHWYQTEKYEALRPLEQLRKCVATNSTFSKIESPTLLLYYYKDKDHHDDVASVTAMKNAFEHFCTEHKGCQKKMVPVADGNHVLTSYYVHGDKAFVIQQMADFLKQF